VIYRVLGELEIGGDGGLLELPGGPSLVVLAALLVNVNRQMSKTELIRAAWGGDDVSEAQLHKRVMEVRNVLARIGRRDDLKTHPRFGYEMRVAEEDIDSLLFQRLVRDAQEAGTERRTEVEIGCLWDALRLWRGPRPLSNVSSDAFRQETMALQQRHKRAAVRLFDLELARGNHEEILDELIRVSGFYPADRRLCEQLMVAQYRCGHPGDVAEAFEHYRHTLAEETGGDPDPLLRAFHFAVARGDEAAIAAAESAIARRPGAPPRSIVTVPRQLPPPVDLVGRTDLAAEASWLLRREPQAAAPVVVISGPGGIGKTALALRAAHSSSDRYPDGQLYMELRGTVGGATDTGEIVAQFLRALGMPRVPDTTAERLAAYRTLLADRRVLLMLDDASDGAQIAELVPANSRCAVLVTARQRLPEISGAHHVAPLEPLGPADAAELFLRVVREGGIAPEDDLDAVGRLVALCGGLPLALRIAGALRVHDHPRPTIDLVKRLASQGPDGFAYGELSVARTIGAGFERLDADARRLLLALGLVPLTGFGLWTAAAVLGGASLDSSAALSRLAARFMIESMEAEPRYRFHDLTREYVRRLALAEYPGDPGSVPGLVYGALLTLTRYAHARLHGGDFEVVHSGVPDWQAPPDVLAEIDASPVGWFEKERSNIRVAVEECARLGLTGICWDLAVSAHEFYTIRGYFDDWSATHTTALSACLAAGDRRGEGAVLVCLNQPALIASRRSGSTSVLELQRAADLLADCGDRHGQAIALRTLAHALRRQGHLTRPLALFNDALGHYTASGDTIGRWQALRFIGQNQLALGNHEQARQALEEAQAIADESGDHRLIAQTRYWIGQACLAAGDLDGAQSAFNAVWDVYGGETGIGHAYAVHGLGDVARCRGEHETAERHLTGAVGLAHEADTVLEGRTWLSIAGLRRDQGKQDEQIAALERATHLFQGCGAAHLEARALAALAQVMSEQANTAAADSAWKRIERLYALAGLPDEDRIYRRPDR
jgi:DNA-binding SARP family transcriptional activator/tetratricopeptide (TPR) repeat protein